MHIRVNPLLAAAALGLLGPAALADDEPDTDEVKGRGPQGSWTRSGDGGEQSLSGTLAVVTVDDRVLLDQGQGLIEGSGRWQVLGTTALVQEVDHGGARIRRELRLDGDQLAVRVDVTDEAGTRSHTDLYERARSV